MVPYKYLCILKQFQRWFCLITCRENDAKLPIILDAKSQRKLLKKRKKSIERRQIWLGGIFLDGSYLWDNDAKSLVSDGFQAWLPGQPDNFQNNEECLMMNQKGRWYDVTCDSQGYVMCEKCTNCESITATQPLSCPNNCSGEGICDSATGQCSCNSGRKGTDCSSKKQLSHIFRASCNGFPIKDHKKTSKTINTLKITKT